MRPRVKICGLRRLEDVQLALALGADDCGFVVAPDSPRAVRVEDLAALAAPVLAAGKRAVLVSRGVPAPRLAEHARRAGIAAVQMHGASATDNARLAAAGCAPWRVVRVAADATRLPPMPAATPTCPALLDVGAGGTGTRFAWRLLGDRAPDHTYVAGGISPSNVAELLRHHPFGIDVSSGVEASPGCKDPTLLRALFTALAAVPDAIPDDQEDLDPHAR